MNEFYVNTRTSQRESLIQYSETKTEGILSSSEKKLWGIRFLESISFKFKNVPEFLCENYSFGFGGIIPVYLAFGDFVVCSFW